MSDIFKDLSAITRLLLTPEKPNALFLALDAGRSGGVWRDEQLTTPLFPGEKIERHRQYADHSALEGA